jgi:hypothetical protein
MAGGDRLEEDIMKYHVTHCGRCGALILCDNSACAPTDHVCYGCIQAVNVMNRAMVAQSLAKPRP